MNGRDPIRCIIILPIALLFVKRSGETREGRRGSIPFGGEIPEGTSVKSIEIDLTS
jgi:hypothetical protein